MHVVRVVYSQQYEFDLRGHIWPTAKYRLVAEREAARTRAREAVKQ